MSAQDNSFEAYRAGKKDGTFNAREISILSALKAIGEGTDRQVKDHLGLSDMNHVRPRITELLDLRVLQHVRDIRCPVTNKTVRVVTLPKIENGDPKTQD